MKTDERGFVVVDEAQRTSHERVYAAGDVTGAPQFVYVAAATGRVAAVNALAPDGASPARVDYTGLPSVVFTRPQLASAGLTEAGALAAGHACDCRVLDLADVPRALVNRDTRGAVKLVADAGTGRVLGVHALADGAGEMMLAATYAIKAGKTVDDVADTWAPYLTMGRGPADRRRDVPQRTADLLLCLTTRPTATVAAASCGPPAPWPCAARCTRCCCSPAASLASALPRTSRPPTGPRNDRSDSNQHR